MPLFDYSTILYSPFWAPIGLIATIIALYFTVRSLRRRSPIYYVRTFELTRDYSVAVPELKIIYRGQPIKNLVVVNIAFWNSGRQPIAGENIAKADPLRIEVSSGTRILYVECLYRSRSAIGFDIEMEKDNASSVIPIGSPKIVFDFLEKNDGGVIRLLVTGEGDVSVGVKGTLVDARIREIRKTITHLKKLFAPVSVTISVVVGVLFIYGFITILRELFCKEMPIGGIIMYIIVAVVTLGLGIISLLGAVFDDALRIPELPKGFEIVDQLPQTE